MSDVEIGEVLERAGYSVAVMEFGEPHGDGDGELGSMWSQLLETEPEILIIGEGVFPQSLESDVALEVGLRRMYLACKVAVRSMIKKRFGRIVAVVPETGNTMVPLAAAMGATGGLMKSIAREVGTRGITANVLAPGRFKSGDGVASPYVAVGRMLEGSDISSALGFLVGEPSSFITGQILAVDGGLTTA